MAVSSSILSRAVERVVFEAKKVTGLGVLPDFIIVGGMKCGSTALFENFLQHPAVFAPRKKEIRFFDRRITKGQNWYRANFPSAVVKTYVQTFQKKLFQTGEATPDYLLHPHVPKRIHAMLPHAKLLFILRNPIERAFSHYQHMVRHGAEKLSFEAALEKEEERLDGEWERMLNDEHYAGRQLFVYSYKRRGMYLDQIKRWTEFFPKEQLFILKSEDYREQPVETMNRISDFVNLPRWDGFVHSAHNEGNYKSKMSAETREGLRQLFEPHNQQLYDYLKCDYQWR